MLHVGLYIHHEEMKLLLSLLKNSHARFQLRSGSTSPPASGPSAPLKRDTGARWLRASSPGVLESLRGSVEVRAGFISEEEELDLLKELEPGLKKKRYEFDHWDDAIHGYRETERLHWGAAAQAVLARVRAQAFAEGSQLLGPVHVLDLDESGYIKPHIDSVKFCGSTIAGLSLLSDSVMRLVRENNTADWVELLLTRRSLYILRDGARFNFTHEILKDAESSFAGQKVARQRRISVICRNLPTSVK
ncbi:alpha-ketoglutarate-dependent dioxygenase alkB homolog 7, mitochondrial-like [Denticeps clupeoides]|uniref:Alpha-ketoglutarate-dependent dioxygenase AlkB-like domain-containing protein n=1 Tax=Denticeps clupeoides TaxID=299321 RepID=A0AAY4CA13_9TELE|nr:alpha-ketoglutarate-dependent dioxygenase alkB homolog 7, mitochondrial-like [Denticeps clupeoides]